MGLTSCRSSCCFLDSSARCLFWILIGVVSFLSCNSHSMERDSTNLEGERNTKVVDGTVTNSWNECGCKFVGKDLVVDAMPLHTGDEVFAFVQGDPLLYEVKERQVWGLSGQNVPKETDLRIKYMSVCVARVNKNTIYIIDEYHIYVDNITKAILGFMPYEGDWLDIEYPVEQGSSRITVHSMKPTQRLRLEKVFVTSICRRKGVLNHTIFFTLDSLHLPLGYTPLVGHMVSVIIVHSTQPNYNWRAISMTPVS